MPEGSENLQDQYKQKARAMQREFHPDKLATRGLDPKKLPKELLHMAQLANDLYSAIAAGNIDTWAGDTTYSGKLMTLAKVDMGGNIHRSPYEIRVPASPSKFVDIITDYVHQNKLPPEESAGPNPGGPRQQGSNQQQGPGQQQGPNQQQQGPQQGPGNQQQGPQQGPRNQQQGPRGSQESWWEKWRREAREGKAARRAEKERRQARERARKGAEDARKAAEDAAAAAAEKAEQGRAERERQEREGAQQAEEVTEGIRLDEEEARANKFREEMERTEKPEDFSKIFKDVLKAAAGEGRLSPAAEKVLEDTYKRAAEVFASSVKKAQYEDELTNIRLQVERFYGAPINEPRIFRKTLGLMVPLNNDMRGEMTREQIRRYEEGVSTPEFKGPLTDAEKAEISKAIGTPVSLGLPKNVGETVFNLEKAIEDRKEELYEARKAAAPGRGRRAA